MQIIKRHGILSTFWHGTLRNSVHCSNYIMQCKMVATLHGAVMVIDLRNVTLSHDNHADCTIIVHIHWHIWCINFTVIPFRNNHKYSWYQTFAVFWMLYAFFWVIPWCLKIEQTECSETLAYKIQMLGNYPEECIQHPQIYSDTV
jgi:hypothetical protein